MVSPPSFYRKGQDTPSVKREQPPTVTGSTIDRLSHHSTKSNGNQTNHSNGIIRLYGKSPLW